MSDKLIKREHAIVPANDFGQTIEDALEKKCWAAFVDEKGVVYPCALPAGHSDDHESESGATMWRERCTSMSGEGTQCRYQRSHATKTHTDGESLMWGENKPAPVGKNDGGIFDALGDFVKNSPAFQQALANRIAKRAPIMQRVPLQKARQYMIGFGPEAIPAGGRVTFVCIFAARSSSTKATRTGSTSRTST